MEPWERDFAAELEKLGEAEVRARFARGEFGLVEARKHDAVKSWLESKESERQSAREIRALAIAEEANSISRKALFNSRLANIIAIIAMILSIAAAIIAAIIGLQK